MSGLLLSEAPLSLPGHLGGIRLIEQSADRRLFLCADLDMGLTLWSKGHPERTFLMSSDGTKARAMDRIHAASLSADGRRAFVAAGLHLRCLDFESGQEVWSYRPANYFGFLQSSPRTAVVLKNQNVFVSSDSGEIALFRPTGERIAKWRSSWSPLFADLHKDGELVVGSDGATLTVWDTDEMRCLCRYRPGARIYSVRVVPHSEKVVMRTEASVAVFDLTSGRIVRSFHTLPGLPYIDASYDGTKILTGEGKGAVVYSMDGERLATIAVESARIVTARCDKSEKTVHVGDSNGQLTSQVLD